MAYLISQDPPINLFDAVKALQMRPDFITPIKTIDAAKAWIEALHAADLMFHFEDSPETIISGATGGDLFTPAEAKNVRKRIAELYALDWAVVGHECPIGYALEVMDPEEHTPTLDHLTEEYASHVAVYKLPNVSAEELIHHDLTEDQRYWVSTFIRRWEAVANMESAA